jgi:hypothetical protein
VPHGEKVADTVVEVPLEIAADRIAVGRMIEPCVEPVGGIRRCRRGDNTADLAEVFATGRLDQSIHCVVDVRSVGIYARVTEKGRLLREILDAGDVSARVVCVREVLKERGGDWKSLPRRR